MQLSWFKAASVPQAGIFCSWAIWSPSKPVGRAVEQNTATTARRWIGIRTLIGLNQALLQCFVAVLMLINGTCDLSHTAV